MPVFGLGGMLAATIGTSVASGVMGAGAADDASQAQYMAAMENIKYQKWAFRQNKQMLKPFIKAARKQIPGTLKAFNNYIGMIKKGPGEFEDSPYYESMEHGIDTAANALAKRGLVTGQGGGAMGKALMRYAVPYAGQQYGNFVQDWINRKLNPTGNVAQIGSSPYAQQIGLGAQNALAAGQGMGNAAQYAGEARASGYLDRNMAWQNALGGIGSVMGMGMGGMMNSLYGR